MLELAADPIREHRFAVRIDAQADARRIAIDQLRCRSDRDARECRCDGTQEDAHMGKTPARCSRLRTLGIRLRGLNKRDHIELSIAATLVAITGVCRYTAVPHVATFLI